MAKIKAPVEGYNGMIGDVRFVDGEATTGDESVIAYCRAAGYTVDEETEPRPLDDSEIAQVLQRAHAEGTELTDDELRERLGQADPSEVREALAESLDPRLLDNGGVVQVGTALRDAAVDPHPGDFLPPTNAGEANPHGPLVVAPGIHAIETQVVRPGPVHVADLAAQQLAETGQAQAILVERRDIGEVTPQFTESSDTGPLGLSDPGSVVAVETGNAADVEDATAPDGTDLEPPAGNASRDEWADYAVRSGQASEEDVAELKRDELRELYAPKG